MPPAICRKWLFVVVMAAGIPSVAGAELRPQRADQFFVIPNQPATLHWRGEHPADKPLEYTILDYGGRQVAAGKATRGQHAQVEVTVQLSPGYYDILLGNDRQPFGVVALPAFEGSVDPFFSIDSALSWLVKEPQVRMELIRVLRRSGIGMSRERLSWGDVQAAADGFQWEGSVGYETLRQGYADRGVKVLEMCHDGPARLGRVGRYPRDLVATAGAWRQIAAHWRPTWGALEIWNEPDISFGDFLPADQYVALLRAVVAGIDQGPIEVPIVGGVFAHFEPHFLDNAAANGLLDCVDVASFHTYARADDMLPLVEKYRAWLKSNGHPAMPLWITECGRPWSKGPDRPPIREGATSALDITMKAVEARACGVTRHFPFVYPFYEERDHNFGMMGRLASPLRSMAAYAQMVRRLAHTQYLGDLRTEDPAVGRARVFGKAESTIVVFYTGKVDSQARLRPGVPVQRVEGIDGRELPLSADGAVPIPDGLAYAQVDRAALGQRLVRQTEAHRLWPTGKPGKRRRVPPVVLRFLPSAENVKPQTKGYQISAQAAARLPIRVEVFNLAAGPIEATLRLEESAGKWLAEGSPTRRVQVPARQSVQVEWPLRLTAAFDRSDRVRVGLTAEAAGFSRPLPLVLDFFGGASLAQTVGRYPHAVRLPIEDLARWQRLATEHAKVELESDREAAWRMKVKFGPGDAWAYPRFRLPDEIDVSRAEALIFRARCVGKATVRAFLWEGGEGVGYLTPAALVPDDGRWHTTVVRMGEFSPSSANTPDPNGRLDLAAVGQISVGLNSRSAENTLELDAVYVVLKP